MNFEEYVESNVYYLVSRGSKPKHEYSKTEVDKMRQELIDRAMFGLKLGIHGKTNIDLLIFYYIIIHIFQSFYCVVRNVYLFPVQKLALLLRIHLD